MSVKMCPLREGLFPRAPRINRRKQSKVFIALSKKEQVYEVNADFRRL
jgi:hypothetical protein